MKYYPLLKIVVVMILLGLLISPTEAVISTSSVNPTKIFKCQPATIAATFSDAGISSVNATLSSTVMVVPDWSQNSNVPTTQSTTINMSYNGTYWVGTFGNNAALLWGNRAITYTITNEGVNSYLSSSTVFVYSDVCVGTGVTNYTQVSSGLGKYTRMLYNGQFDFFGTSLDTSIIGWALYPWIEYWGMLFYLMVIFIICSTIYLKTQNVIQPLVIGVLLLLIFAGTSAIDEIYRQWIIFILALLMAAIYYRVFVRD